MAAKQKVSTVAKRIGVSEKDLVFQLQSLGCEIHDANQVLEPEVIQALMTGKKVNLRTRSMIFRGDAQPGEKLHKVLRATDAKSKPSITHETETFDVALASAYLAHRNLLKAIDRYAAMLQSHNAALDKALSRIGALGGSRG